MSQEDLTKRLPAELLTMIFQAWKDLCVADRHGLGAEWVRSTWVCKTWRDVALKAVSLWSSVYVSRCLADDPTLKTQLDRAHGVALDLLVVSVEMSVGELEGVFDFVSSRTKSVRQLEVIYNVDHQTAVKGFVEDVGAELVSLSLSELSSNDYSEWEFTPDIFPRLRHLYLDRIIPTAPGAPLLTLIQLEVVYAYDDLQQELMPTQEYHLSTRLHRFLAVCPNLESLRMAGSSVPPALVHGELPSITLPKLRYLSLEGPIDGLDKMLGSLRLPPSVSFHITAEANGCPEGDLAIGIIPRNVSESLPPIRNTRRLSLMVGQEDPRHLSLRGSSGDTLEDESQAGWSITIPNLSCMFEAMRSFYPFPDLKLAELYYLGYNGKRFLTHIPHLVIPSLLVELQLHFAHGLPVARDWARFFATMPHLRTLGIGGGALVAEVLEAFHVDPSLCGELQDLALCAAAGRSTEEVRLLSFFRDVVGSCVQKRARAGTGVRSLTVRLPVDDSRSHSHHGGGGDGDNRGLAGRPDAEPVGLASELRQGLACLEDFVGRVVVETVDCPACGMEYELPQADGDFESNDEDGTCFY